MKMRNILKKFVYLGLLFLTIYYGQGFYEYYRFKKVSSSFVRVARAGAMQSDFADVDGCKVTKYVPACVLDTPLPGIGPFCNISCTLLSPALMAYCMDPINTMQACIASAPAGTAGTVCANQIKDVATCMPCNTYQEITTTCQYGTPFIGPKIGFPFAGMLPTPGSDLLYAGDSPILVKVVGTPSPSVGRVMPLINTYARTVGYLGGLIYKVAFQLQ